MPGKQKPWLIADIGGTNARFALFDHDLTAAPDTFREEQVLPTRDYPTLRDAAEAYLQQVGMAAPADRPDYAAFGIANPIAGDLVQMTNHSWRFSISGLQAELGLKKLLMLNDFSALALALPHLSKEETVQVGGGDKVPDTAIALLGAGTGLGVSGLVPNGHGGWVALSGEGGHATFSPFNERERAIMDFAQTRLGGHEPHVSTERFLCGGGGEEPMGLTLIYEAVCHLDGVPHLNYSPADISTLGVSGADVQCRETIDLFCAMLGTAAANLTLTLGARGGCFIGGGVVPRLGDYFAKSPFRARFEAKGRFSEYLKAVPAFVIHAKYPAFTGAVAALQQFVREQ
ncbi:glucokinase [Leeia oryzae]|uniref:glucokinase n=1 Tax=Leeia oryzae TaxID=356662 RepID=UPI000360EDB4|nr:glucokinase [Leeia oryzae]